GQRQRRGHRPRSPGRIHRLAPHHHRAARARAHRPGHGADHDVLRWRPRHGHRPRADLAIAPSMPEAAPTVAGKRARNQAARRQRVIEAAMALATQGGYDAVQMRDVAATADVALGTLYRYFPSKDHLLIAAQEEWAQALRQRLAQKPPRGNTPAD